MFRSFIGLLLWITPCMAEIIVVTDDGSGDYPTIQNAINAAVNGDVIELQPGTYKGSGNRDIDFKGKAVTVRGTDPNDPDVVAATIIDCQGTEVEPHRGFYIYRGEGVDSMVIGLTITNGCATRGGAIRCHETSPTIAFCNIVQNTAFLVDMSDGGAGIYCFLSNSLITDCRFIGNVAKGDADGGAIRCSYLEPRPMIRNCFLSGNRGDRGGGLFNFDGPVTNCVFVGNLAKYGGALHSCDGPISDCIITGNSAEGQGAMDFCNGPISGCLVSGNRATVWGGGGLGWCHTAIENCIITGNQAAVIGGGIYNSSAIARNCIIYGNSAGNCGGGVGLMNGEQLNLVNSIIWNNTAALGSQVGLREGSPGVSLTYCDVEGGKSAVYEYPDSSLVWGIGNIDADPCFVTAGYWNANGTPDDPSDDLWVNGDYHLKSEAWRWSSEVKQWTSDDVTSRCIDAGNPGTPLGEEPLTLDVDPLNHSGHNIRVDIGAYGGTAEASMPIHEWALAADLNNDGRVSLEDLAAQASDWQETADEQPGDLDWNRTVDINDLLILTEDWLKRTIWS
ncbi:MAG: hypothetical protein LLF76_14825 [Planctomycetaceae bacterium]|nr:hypothetical protein [Planctomycetaceae bacterium]